MLKAKGMIDGHETLMLGLEHGNLDKFKNDPDTYIHIKAGELNIPFDIIIFAAEDTIALFQKISGGVDENTKIRT